MASIAGPSSLSTGRSSNPKLKKVAAQSSFLAEFEYDAPNETLTTHMRTGAIYQHKDVSPGDFAALETAKNQSKHWSNFIRGKKQSVKVLVAKAPNSEIKKGRK